VSKERLSWFFTDTSQKRYHLEKPDHSILYNITLSCHLLSPDYFVSITWNLCKSMEFEKSSLIKQKLLPHRRIRMCTLSWMLIYRSLTQMPSKSVSLPFRFMAVLYPLKASRESPHRVGQLVVTRRYRVAS
jgi:hypothetical protein